GDCAGDCIDNVLLCHTRGRTLPRDASCYGASMAGKTLATVEELRAELDRVRRESLRAETERARAEDYKERLDQRDRELAQVRDQLQKTLQAAEGQLAAAAAKFAESSKPPPPNTQARELDDTRVRAARLQSELVEIR